MFFSHVELNKKVKLRNPTSSSVTDCVLDVLCFDFSQTQLNISHMGF